MITKEEIEELEERNAELYDASYQFLSVICEESLDNGNIFDEELVDMDKISRDVISVVGIFLKDKYGISIYRPRVVDVQSGGMVDLFPYK